MSITDVNDRELYPTRHAGEGVDMTDMLLPIKTRLHDARAESIRLSTELEDAQFRIAELEAENARLKDEKLDYAKELGACKQDLHSLKAELKRYKKVIKDEVLHGNYQRTRADSIAASYLNERDISDGLRLQLADRDKREGELVTDLADLYEKYNELREDYKKCDPFAISCLQGQLSELREAVAEFLDAMDAEGGMPRLYTDREVSALKAIRALLPQNAPTSE